MPPGAGKNKKIQKQFPLSVRRVQEFCKLEIFTHSINRLLWKEPTKAVNPAVCL